MNKKSIAIWMLFLCTSIGTCLKIAAMESQASKKAKETTQEEAQYAQKKPHLRIKFGVKRENNTDSKDTNDMGEDIKALRENGMLILELPSSENDYPLMILQKEKVLEACKAPGIGKELTELTQDDFFKVINNVLKETPYKCNAKNDIMQADAPYEQFNNSSGFNVKLGRGAHDPMCFIILEKEKKSDLPQKNSLTKGQKGLIVASILLVGMAAAYSLWESNKKEEGQDKRKEEEK